MTESTNDKLKTAHIAQADLVDMLRAVQAERDQLVARVLTLESTVTKQGLEAEGAARKIKSLKAEEAAAREVMGRACQAAGVHYFADLEGWIETRQGWLRQMAEAVHLKENGSLPATVVALADRAEELEAAVAYYKTRATELDKVGTVYGHQFAPGSSVYEVVKGEKWYNKRVLVARQALADHIRQIGEAVACGQAPAIEPEQVIAAVKDKVVRLATLREERDVARRDLAVLEATIGQRLGAYGQVPTPWPEMHGTPVIGALTPAVQAVRRAGDAVDLLVKTLQEVAPTAEPEGEPIGRAVVALRDLHDRATRQAATIAEMHERGLQDETCDEAADHWASIAGALWNVLDEIAGMTGNDWDDFSEEHLDKVHALTGRRHDLIAAELVPRGGPVSSRATDDARELVWFRDIYERSYLRPEMLSNTTGQKWAIVPLEQVKHVADWPLAHVVQHKDGTGELKTTDRKAYASGIHLSRGGLDDLAMADAAQAARAAILAAYIGLGRWEVTVLRRPTDALGEQLRFETWAVDGDRFEAVSCSMANARHDTLSDAEKKALKALQGGKDDYVFVSVKAVREPVSQS